MCSHCRQENFSRQVRLQEVPTRKTRRWLDDLPGRGHQFQGLGDIFAQLAKLAATAGAGGIGGVHNALARQMCRQRTAGGLLGVLRRARLSDSGGRVRLGRRFDKISKLQLELIDQPGAAFRRRPERVAPHLGNGELEVGDLGVAIQDPSFCFLGTLLGGRQQRPQRRDVV